MRRAFLVFALLLAACGQEAPTQDSFAPSVGTGTADASTTSEVSTRLAIEANFDEAAQFAEGLAAVRIGGKYGYIDKRGNFAVEPRYSFARPFKNGLGYVVVGRGGGYIKPNGELVWRSDES